VPDPFRFWKGSALPPLSVSPPSLESKRVSIHRICLFRSKRRIANPFSEQRVEHPRFITSQPTKEVVSSYRDNRSRLKFKDKFCWPPGWREKYKAQTMKPLRASDFRSRRLMLQKTDFALARGRYPGPTNLIEKGTWESIVSLPDDVSIRTSDKYGPQLHKMWEYWGTWVRVVLAVQDLSKDPTESPIAIAASDAADEIQASIYCALVGYYRVAFSCLRNVLEQMTIGARLALVPDPKYFSDWRNANDKLGFGWAADTLAKNQDAAALEKHLKLATADSLFAQNPKGVARRLFAELSKYTHGAAGFTDADSRESNGPIFVPKAFLAWCVASLKTYAIVLHELKLAHPQLKNLPYGPPRMTLDQFRRRMIR